MKLYRFTASSTHKAIFTAHESLGPTALIYSTRKIPNGVEVLAGLPFDIDKDEEKDDLEDGKQVVEVKKLPATRIKAQQNQGSSIDNMVIESLKIQIQNMNENIQVLSEHVATLHEVFIQKFYTKKLHNWNVFKNLNLTKFLRAKKYGRTTTV